MKQEIIDGGPAFPIQESAQMKQMALIPHYGMSLRDWMAGIAMSSSNRHALGLTCEESAKFAYQMADTMIKQRIKEVFGNDKL